MATSDRKVIEDQLAHAIKTGNKKRAKRLQDRLKQIKDYESGKTHKAKPGAGRGGRGPSFADSWAQQRGFRDWANATNDQFYHAGESTKEWYDPKDRRSQHFKKKGFSAYHDARKEQRTWTGGSAAVLGDRKRARKQKYGRYAGKVNAALEHPNTRTGMVIGGYVGFLGGLGRAGHNMKKEAEAGVKHQVGKESNKRRGKMRRSYAAAGASLGMVYGAYLGNGKAGLGGAAVGGAIGYLGGRRAAPNNKMSQKQWVVYTKKVNGQVIRVKRKNPHWGKKAKKK